MAEASDRLNITLRVDQAIYHLRVSRDEERTYRMAEKLVNDRLNHYVQKSPGLNPDEYLRRMALDMALTYCRMQDRNDTEPIMKSIEGLTREIEEKL